SVWWLIKTILTLSYFVRRKRTIQKKKLRAMYFLNSPIEPLTSIIAMTTAFDSYLISSSQVLNRRSSFLIGPSAALPLSGVWWRMFSRIVRRLSRLDRTPVRRISVNLVVFD